MYWVGGEPVLMNRALHDTDYVTHLSQFVKRFFPDPVVRISHRARERYHDLVINHQYKAIFIHQRKCAGNSIMAAFGQKSFNPEGDYMNDGSLSAEYHDSKQRYPEYFKFAVVRNPWDKFISAWLFGENTAKIPMREVLRHLPPTGFDYRHVTRLQRETLHDESGNLIVDKLIRYEKLAEGFDVVSDRLGKPRCTLEHRLRNIHRDPYPYQEYFQDPIDRDLFMLRFARDVETFEYEF
jgi:hypothetical protein